MIAQKVVVLCVRKDPTTVNHHRNTSPIAAAVCDSPVSIGSGQLRSDGPSSGRAQRYRFRDTTATMGAGRLVLALLLSLSLVSAGGCSLFRGKSKQDPTGMPLAAQGSGSEEVFLRVREAKAQNSVVVQVIGDSVPVRVLPLPPGERSVFVSDLLKQTGLQDKMGAIKVTVYRHSTHSPMGIPMDVRFTAPGGDVRPESDYALRAGDRLRIAEDDRSMIAEMLNAFIPMR